MSTILSRLAAALCLSIATPLLAMPVPHPRLIIVISVDQFASSVYNRYASDYSDGLKRLSDGMAFPIAYQSHAATETCPGHSTLLTGDHPSHTGIVSNSWFDRSTGSTLYCVSVAGTGDPSARGPQKLKATTLGDWLKQAHPRSRIVSISGKDRAAIMMGGHHPDLVAWWVDGQGFETSRFAGPAGPDIQALLQKDDQAIFGAWRTSRPTLWPAAVPAFCRELEKHHHFGDVEVSGSVPPAAAAESIAAAAFADRTDFADALHASPLIDSLTLDLAAAVAKSWNLGSDRDPDLLAISLSATDYIGHRYGNGGAEMCAQVQALDQSLGIFLRRIDQLGVPYMVVLTADHGSIDAPERLNEEGVSAIRVDPDKFLSALNKHLKEALNVPWDPITSNDPQQLYINSPGDPAFLERVRTETVSWLKQQPSVETVLTSDIVARSIPASATSPADLSLAERLNESFDPQRSADIFVEFKKNSTLLWPRSESDPVAGHGSPWDYDRQVPILFWWPGAQKMVSPAAIETVDIAPTLASILEIASPSVDGRCLPSVTACSSTNIEKATANRP